MTPPTGTDLATYMGPNHVANDVMGECVEVAVELVEQRIGAIEDRDTGEAMAREAILIIAKHLYGVRHNPSAQSAQFANGDYTPGPAGYLIPNRAASLMDALWATDPGSIGIG